MDFTLEDIKSGRVNIMDVLEYQKDEIKPFARYKFQDVYTVKNWRDKIAKEAEMRLAGKPLNPMERAPIRDAAGNIKSLRKMVVGNPELELSNIVRVITTPSKSPNPKAKGSVEFQVIIDPRTVAEIERGATPERTTLAYRVKVSEDKKSFEVFGKQRVHENEVLEHFTDTLPLPLMALFIEGLKRYESKPETSDIFSQLGIDL